MRTILAVIFVFIYLLFGLFFLGIEWIISKFNKRHADIATLKSIQLAFRCVMFISGVKMNVKGHENVPSDEAVLYIGNHRSIFDIVTTYSLCPNLTGYVAKSSVRRIPVLGLFMKRAYCLFMDRGDMKQSLKTILQAIEQVEAGVSICIFPEGTRNKNKENPAAVLPFKEGSLKIAQKAKCKIVPMAIIGTDEVFENHLPWIHKKNVTIVYGEPIVIEELPDEDKKHLGAYCQHIVEDMLARELAA